MPPGFYFFLSIKMTTCFTIYDHFDDFYFDIQKNVLHLYCVLIKKI